MLTGSLEEHEIEMILQIVSDRYYRKILHSMIERPKSAFEISSECDILVSTVYRKLKMLKEFKIVYTRCMLTPDGKKRFLYQSRISSISATMSKDILDIKVIPNTTAN